jgi:hypothetical protein
MKILLKNHGANLSGVKSDLYTLIGGWKLQLIRTANYQRPFIIGLDSKHASGIPSTVGPSVNTVPCSHHPFLGLEEFCSSSGEGNQGEFIYNRMHKSLDAYPCHQELKDAYFAELASGSAIRKPATSETNTAKEPTPGVSGHSKVEDANPEKAAKVKPKLKKKAQDDDFFASEEENNNAETDKTEEPSKRKRAPASKTNGSKANIKGVKKINDDEDEEIERPKKKRTVK